jgi:hypothetical protein
VDHYASSLTIKADGLQSYPGEREEYKTMKRSQTSDKGNYSNELSLVVMEPGAVTLHK